MIIVRLKPETQDSIIIHENQIKDEEKIIRIKTLKERNQVVKK